MSGDRRPFWAKCSPCGHCWPIAYLPAPMALVAKLIVAPACPMCGSDAVLVARQEGGRLLEPGAALGPEIAAPVTGGEG